MTGLFFWIAAGGARSLSGPAEGGRSRCFALQQPCPLTVPLLSSGRGAWLEVEGANQIQGGGAHVEVVLSSSPKCWRGGRWKWVQGFPPPSRRDFPPKGGTHAPDPTPATPR